MKSSKKIDSFQQIKVDELKPGMYVTGIFKTPTSRLRVKSEGYIRDLKKISDLKKAGIHFVSIDPSKEKKQDKIDNIFSNTTNEEQQKPTNTVSLDKEIQRAVTVVEEAKKLQKKFIKSIKTSQHINLNVADKVTSSIVDCVTRNKDALMCMSGLRSKNSYLIEHIINTSVLMTIFANYLGFDEETTQQLALGAFLHETGKVLLPEDILNKPTKLTPLEYDMIKSHILLGIEKLQTSDNKLSDITLAVVSQQSERLDGSGYPNSLSNDDISLYGRMMAIIDSYDAMTSERVYRKAIAPINAFKKLMNVTPDKLDQELVEKFIQCLGVYPVGTLVKLNSGKVGLVSQLNNNKPLNPFVRVFYNVKLKQAIPIQEIDLSKSKFHDQIDSSINPEDFNLNLIGFFKEAFS